VIHCEWSASARARERVERRGHPVERRLLSPMEAAPPPQLMERGRERDGGCGALWAGGPTMTAGTNRAAASRGAYDPRARPSVVVRSRKMRPTCPSVRGRVWNPGAQ
jgi:hypothetical protein